MAVELGSGQGSLGMEEGKPAILLGWALSAYALWMRELILRLMFSGIDENKQGGFLTKLNIFEIAMHSKGNIIQTTGIHLH